MAQIMIAFSLEWNTWPLSHLLGFPHLLSLYLRLLPVQNIVFPLLQEALSLLRKKASRSFLTHRDCHVIPSLDAPDLCSSPSCNFPILRFHPLFCQLRRNMADAAGGVVAAAYVLTAASYMIILSRILFRRLKHEAFKPDDYLMLFASVLYTVYTAAFIMAVSLPMPISQRPYCPPSVDKLT
jgi:hypothetical protein